MPPELAGRDEVIQAWELMLNRVRHEGRVGAVDTVLVGLRGVGKSALLSRLDQVASERGFATIRLQGNTESSVVESLLEEALRRVERGESRWESARRALGRITGVSVNLGGVGIGVDREPQPAASRTQHPEQLASTLAELAAEIRATSGGGLVLSIDEFQLTRPEDIRLLGGVLNHLNTAHPDAPVVFVAGGLPNLPDRMVGPDPDHPYITNPERLFAFEALPVRLSPTAAAVALIRPAQRVGAGWHPEAVDAVLAATGGYPAHLQIYAAAAWVRGDGVAAVTVEDVAETLEQAAANVETQFLRPRWERLTGHQQAYLTAIALVGDEAPTQAVAAILGTPLSGQSMRRRALLRRGEIFEPGHGRVQLSMPAMREYALRHYPESASQDPGLLPPTEMMANLADWRTSRAARRVAIEAFPESVLERRPDGAG